MGIAGRVAETIINNHKISLEGHLCSRYRTQRSECESCAVHCPVEAIKVSGNGVEIAGGCTSCGVCVSVCPSGTFRLKERDDEEIVREIGARCGTPGGGLFGITCEHGKAVAELVVPCLSRLTEAMLLEPLRTGASGVVIMQPACEGCPASKAAAHLETVFKRAQQLADLIGTGRDKLITTEIPFRSSKSAPANPVSRRGFFESLRATTLGIAAASIPDIARGEAANEELFRTAVAGKMQSRKRSLLLKCLRDGASWHPGSKAPAPRELRVSSGDALIAELEVSRGCTACGVCATLCPAGALTLVDEADIVRLGFRPDLCTNCRVCEETCRPKALHLKPEVLLNRLLEDHGIVLFEARKKPCHLCRTDFIGEGSDVCPLCTSRHGKQAAMIQF